eukprot:358404-Chlamydomonas_euryale.AAC.7
MQDSGVPCSSIPQSRSPHTRARSWLVARVTAKLAPSGKLEARNHIIRRPATRQHPDAAAPLPPVPGHVSDPRISDQEHWDAASGGRGRWRGDGPLWLGDACTCTRADVLGRMRGFLQPTDGTESSNRTCTEPVQQAGQSGPAVGRRESSGDRIGGAALRASCPGYGAATAEALVARLWTTEYRGTTTLIAAPVPRLRNSKCVSIRGEYLSREEQPGRGLRDALVVAPDEREQQLEQPAHICTAAADGSGNRRVCAFPSNAQARSLPLALHARKCENMRMHTVSAIGTICTKDVAVSESYDFGQPQAGACPLLCRKKPSTSLEERRTS